MDDTTDSNALLHYDALIMVRHDIVKCNPTTIKLQYLMGKYVFIANYKT